MPKGYLISLAYDPSKKSCDKKEQLTIRFIVAHEIGHIILHEDAKLREFDTGPENKSLPYIAKERRPMIFRFPYWQYAGNGRTLLLMKFILPLKAKLKKLLHL